MDRFALFWMLPVELCIIVTQRFHITYCSTPPMMFCGGLLLAAAVVTTNAGTSTFKVSSGDLILSPGASVRDFSHS